jgi:hypothetical protein
LGGRAEAADAVERRPRHGGDELKVVTTNTTGDICCRAANTYHENAVITEYFAAHSDFGTTI